MLPQEKKRILFRWLKQNNLFSHWCYCYYNFPSAQFTLKKWENLLEECASPQVEYLRFRDLVQEAPFTWNDKTNPKIKGFPSWDIVETAWGQYMEKTYKNIFIWDKIN